VSEAPDASPVLLVPGWTGSGPDHWQSVWQRTHPGWRWVVHDDWDRPDPATWIATLDATVAGTLDSTGRPPVLVGHSLGALLVVAWTAARPDVRAAGALLVAPPDVEQPETPAALLSFAPIPRARLPFPAVLAASRDDPYLSWNRAEEFAASWGASLHDCGRAGHLNTAAGYGPWPEGEELLTALLDRVG
jgi:uncharacterized protein